MNRVYYIWQLLVVVCILGMRLIMDIVLVDFVSLKMGVGELR